MKRHYTKVDFNVVAVTVIVFEVLAFSVFLFGIISAVYNMFFSPPILTLWGFLIVVLGSTIVSFFLLTIAEFLQLLLKIEVNTRKEDLIVVKKEEKIIKKETPVVPSRRAPLKKKK